MAHKRRAQFSDILTAMSLTVTLLGTGTSTGIPIVGCDCECCRSPDPRDRRDRPGAMVGYEIDGETHNVLIDTPTELRHQLIRHRVNRVDAVVYTHNHADHIFGLDDLRRINAVMGRHIDVYAEPNVIDWIRTGFRYIFEPHANPNQSWVPQLETHAVSAGGRAEIAGRPWRPLRLMHGKIPILGFRVGDFAYCTDCSEIPPETMEQLRGLDVLVIDALRHRPHPTHLTVEQALEIVEELQPGRTYFTHIAHDIIHAQLEPKLPEHVALGHDGLVIEVSDT